MKSFNFNLLTLFFATILIYGCGSQKVDLSKSNEKEALKVVDQLHNLMQKNQYDATHVLFSEKFKAVNDWKDVYMIYDSCQKLGNMKMQEISSCDISEGAKSSVIYDLMVQVTRTNVNSIEEYRMEKTDGTPKIVSFKIVSVPFTE